MEMVWSEGRCEDPEVRSVERGYRNDIMLHRQVRGPSCLLGLERAIFSGPDQRKSCVCGHIFPCRVIFHEPFLFVDDRPRTKNRELLSRRAIWLLRHDISIAAEKERKRNKSGAARRVKGDNCDGHDLVLGSHARLRERNGRTEKEILVFRGGDIVRVAGKKRSSRMEIAIF